MLTNEVVIPLIVASIRFREWATERIAGWRKLADAVNQYLEKGSQVFVEGELKEEPATAATAAVVEPG